MKVKKNIMAKKNITINAPVEKVWEAIQDPAVLALRGRIDLVASPELTAAVPARQAVVEISTASGTFLHHARDVRGTPGNPMTADEIEAKALDLVGPIIGLEMGRALIAVVNSLDRMDSVRILRPCLEA